MLAKSKTQINYKTIGLEFPVVFLVGCSEGLLPHSKATDIDDEMRLITFSKKSPTFASLRSGG